MVSHYISRVLHSRIPRVWNGQFHGLDLTLDGLCVEEIASSVGGCGEVCPDIWDDGSPNVCNKHYWCEFEV